MCSEVAIACVLFLSINLRMCDCVGVNEEGHPNKKKKITVCFSLFHVITNLIMEMVLADD